jgi:branched-chain amino acid transport system substrate-binding protein
MAPATIIPFDTEVIMFRKLLLTAFAALGLAFNSGAWSQNIKIAILGPMAFVQGENHWAGAEMARDEINKAGGISVGGAKRQIEIIKIDTNEIQSVPDATNAIERAISRDKVDFLVGGFRSEAVIAMQEVAMDAKKLFMGVGAADAKLGMNVEQNYERYKYWFRASPTKSPDLARTLFAVLGSIAGQIRTDLKKEVPKVAIVAEKAVWTEAITKAVQENLPKMKMEVVGLWQPSPIATDVTAELSAIKRANADIVFTIISGPLGIVLGRQMGELQLPAVAWGINVEAQKDGFWQATAGKGNYVSTLDTYAEVETTPKTIPFVKAFKARFNKSPTYTAATYDVLYVLKDAIEKVGSLDADKLVPYIEKSEFVGTGAVATYDKRHDLVWEVGKTSGIAVEWLNGEKVPFWPPQTKGMKPFKLPQH